MENWKIRRLKGRGGDVLLMLIFSVLYQNLSSCWCLNEEGLALLRIRDRIESDPFGALRGWHEYDGETNPCSWFGIECSDGKVIVLNLKDLCLGGTLASEIGNLAHVKSIILRNNTFSGIIPEEIGELKELEVLDLGYNNFSGPLPYKLGNNLSLAILLLDNNELLAALSPELYQFKIISEVQVDESLLSGSRCEMRPIAQNMDCIRAQTSVSERVLAETPPSKSSPYLRGQNPSSAPTNKTKDPIPADPPVVSTSLPPTKSPVPSPAQSSVPPSSSPASSNRTNISPQTSPTSSNRTNNSSQISPTSSNQSDHSPAPTRAAGGSGMKKVPVISAVVGGSAFLFFIILGVYLYRRNKVTLVKPWATGLSGQLQKAFVTGVPQLKRLELEIACEDFSNVVGASSIGMIYKGTLSSGVEIAVASVAVKSANEWSVNLEAQFRKKIDMLSKVNHKNFVNLIGYCQEEDPFTRMMVFEYAPNGTLFEHLHIKEAEHLDWAMRVRIAMGMAYCLEHMHQLNPPIPHKNLASSAVALTEDYAAKISDFNLWNQLADSEYAGIELVENSSAGPERNVYSFGVILFEMVTGRIPYSVDNGLIEDWASDYVRGDRPLSEMVDPTLSSFDADQVEKIGKIIRSCVRPDPDQRPSMREVSLRLRSATGIPPDRAIPKISPLWWAELEILSAEGS